jgi:hypothetical protein
MNLGYLSNHLSIESVLGIAQGRHDSRREAAEGRYVQYDPFQTCFNYFQKVCIAHKYNKHCLPHPSMNILSEREQHRNMIPMRMHAILWCT